MDSKEERGKNKEGKKKGRQKKEAVFDRAISLADS